MSWFSKQTFSLRKIGRRRKLHSSINLILTSSFSRFYRPFKQTRWSRSKETGKRSLLLSPSINPIVNQSCLLSAPANKIIGMYSFTLVARQLLPRDFLIGKKKMPQLCFDSIVQTGALIQLFNNANKDTALILWPL